MIACGTNSVQLTMGISSLTVIVIRWSTKKKKVPHSSERIFPVSDVAVRQAWDRLRKRSNLDDLTFHDLRHEAISRMFEKGLNISEVMAVSGHRTASQLFRYVQITPKQFN